MRLGVLFVCLAATLWGLDGVVLTPRLFALPVAFVVFLLHALPFLIAQPFLYRSYKRIAALSPGDFFSLVLVALFGGVVGTLSLVHALFLTQFNQLSVVILLQKLQPVFAIALAALLLKERLYARFLLWAGVAIGGAYLLTFGFSLPDFSAPNSIEAAVYAVIAAAAFGSATVFGKRIVTKLDFASTTFGRFGLTALFAAVIVPFMGGFAFGSMTGTHWLIFLIIAFTTGGGALLLYYYGLRSIKATTSTIAELCLPLSAILFDWLVNGSVLAPAQWLGAAVLVAAITRISLGQATGWQGKAL
ncbi:DMT family transporter [Candidatus Woesearchaeota archaeon]|nr:MAG: DMT family transporter [Candidatus Woesearchaeota archaeon]